jgi:hypothetical protein
LVVVVRKINMSQWALLDIPLHSDGQPRPKVKRIGDIGPSQDRVELLDVLHGLEHEIGDERPDEHLHLQDRESVPWTRVRAKRERHQVRQAWVCWRASCRWEVTPTVGAVIDGGLRIKEKGQEKRPTHLKTRASFPHRSSDKFNPSIGICT